MILQLYTYFAKLSIKSSHADTVNVTGDTPANLVAEAKATIDGGKRDVVFGLKLYSITINPRKIRIDWNTYPNAPQSSFVYNGSSQGLSGVNIVFEMANENDVFEKVGEVSINGNTLTISGVIGDEVLNFTISNFTFLWIRIP